jgi:hypothetical protein
MINKWLTISITPPKLDVKINVRTADKYGYGCSMEVVEFDSAQYDEQEAADYLETTDFIEWLELPV